MIICLVIISLIVLACETIILSNMFFFNKQGEHAAFDTLMRFLSFLFNKEFIIMINAVYFLIMTIAKSLLKKGLFKLQRKG